MDLPDLRPLSFGELLDRTFTYYRRHFWLFVGIMVVPQAFIVLFNVAGQIIGRIIPHAAVFAPSPATSPAAPGPFFPTQAIAGIVVGALTAIILSLAYFVFYSIALGATTYAVSEIHLGRPTTARASYRALRGRVWRLMAVIFSVILLAILIYMLAFLVGGVVAGLLSMLAGSLGRGLVILAGLLGVGVLVASAVISLWLILRYTCAVPALLLEKLKADAALKRSFKLMKGSSGRALLLIILMYLVTLGVTLIVNSPFVIAILYYNIKLHSLPPLWISILSALAGGASGAAMGPLMMIALVLLYYDLRVRKEGFDLQAMMAALDTQSPVEAPAGSSSSPAAPDLEAGSVFSVLLLSGFTLGIYIPIWFLQRRAGLNSLRSRESLGRSVFVLMVLLECSVFAFGLWFIEWTHKGHTFDPRLLAGYAMLTALLWCVLLMTQAFKVLHMLEAHTAGEGKGPLGRSIALVEHGSYSPIATFFFGIFYLQYKINELVDSWSAGSGLPGTEAIPLA